MDVPNPTRKNDLSEVEKEPDKEKDRQSRFGKFVPWFPGLGALIVFLILRACGVLD